jgi:hypothetical protein
MLDRFSAGLPRVKSIAEDAAEWDSVYRSVVEAAWQAAGAT